MDEDFTVLSHTHNLKPERIEERGMLECRSCHNPMDFMAEEAGNYCSNPEQYALRTHFFCPCGEIAYVERKIYFPDKSSCEVDNENLTIKFREN